MSKITKGEVAITLAGADHTLTPSLQAFSTLASRYDNHNELLKLIFASNVPAMIHVLRLGLGFNDKQAKTLPELVFKTGAPTLIEPLSDYVFRLFNGGLSADEWMAKQSAAQGGGDAPLTLEDVGDEENPLLAS